MRLKLFPTRTYASLPDDPPSSGYVPLPPQPDLERRRGDSTASSGSAGSAGSTSTARSKESISMSSASSRAGSTFGSSSAASSPSSCAPSPSTVTYNPFLPPPPAPAIDITIPTKAETCAAEGHVLRRGFL